MSKNLRDYLQVDTVHSIKVQAVTRIDESKLYIKSMTI